MKKIIFFVLATLCYLSSLAANSVFAHGNIPIQATASGIDHTVLKEGHGQKPTIHDEVEIRFTSYNSKGEIVDGTLNQVPVILPISEMFAGLQESLLLMPVGSFYEFDIPMHLGYQEEGKRDKQAIKYRIELLRIIP